MKTQWLIYGANGYTGKLVVQEAVARGQRPILAGRNADSIGAMAKELGLTAFFRDTRRVQRDYHRRHDGTLSNHGR